MDAKALTPSQKSSIHVKAPQCKILKTSLDVDICSASMVGISPFQPPSCHDVFCFPQNVFAENKSALYFRYWTILVSGHLVFPSPVFYFLDKFSFKQVENWDVGVKREREGLILRPTTFVKGAHSSLLYCCPGNTAPRGKWGGRHQVLQVLSAQAGRWEGSSTSLNWFPLLQMRSRNSFYSRKKKVGKD